MNKPAAEAPTIPIGSLGMEPCCTWLSLAESCRLTFRNSTHAGSSIAKGPRPQKVLAGAIAPKETVGRLQIAEEEVRRTT